MFQFYFKEKLDVLIMFRLASLRYPRVRKVKTSIDFIYIIQLYNI